MSTCATWERVHLLRQEKKKKSFHFIAAAAAVSFQLGPTLCDAMDCSQPSSSVCGDSPGKNPGIGCHTFLQRIFPPGIKPRSALAGKFFTTGTTRVPLSQVKINSVFGLSLWLIPLISWYIRIQMTNTHKPNC